MVFSFDIVSIKENTNLERKRRKSPDEREKSIAVVRTSPSRSCRYETEGKSVISILLPKRNCVFVRIIRSFFLLLLLSSRQFLSMVYSLIIDYLSALFILRKNFLLLGTVLSFLDGSISSHTNRINEHEHGEK